MTPLPANQPRIHDLWGSKWEGISSRDMFPKEVRYLPVAMRGFHFPDIGIHVHASAAASPGQRQDSEGDFARHRAGRKALALIMVGHIKVVK